MTDKPFDGENPAAGMPVPKLHWVVTNPDGTIAAEGWATPVVSGAAAVQGQDQAAQDAPESDD